MSDIQTLRVWKCAHCQSKSTWRPGWNWRLTNAVETLDSFDAFCSPTCSDASGRASA